MPSRSTSSSARLRAAASRDFGLMGLDGLREVVEDALDRVEEVIGSWKTIPISAPRTSGISRSDERHQVASVEP